MDLMARIRSIKPEFWQKRSMSRYSRDARLLYIALWNQADEHGRMHGDTRFVKGHCLPYDDDLGLGDIDRLLAELERGGKVQRYEVDGDPFLYLPNLAEHQRLEAAKVPSRLPAPPNPDESESRADLSAPRAESSETTVALHVAGGREQVAGNGAAAPRADDEVARAQEITRRYHEAEPMCRFPAVLQIVRKAIQAQRWTDDQITDALLRLAKEGRPVTVDVLRVELDGLPPPRAQSQNTRNLSAAMERARRAEEAGA